MSANFTPYADLHKSPAGPGDARPTARKVIEDNGLTNKLTGKVAIVTGATSGVGVEIARALYITGADVYITARDAEKGREVVDEIMKSGEGQGNMGVLEMEMSSLESVKKAAGDFLAKSSKLNILVNNAGIMAVPELTKTADGFEQQFGVNHLAHYTFTALLLPIMIKSSTPEFASRVVSCTSAGHGFSTVHFEDTNLTNTYNPWVGYGQSKTSNIWLANYIDRIYGSQGVHATSAHPGAIMTPLYKHLSDEYKQAVAGDATFLAALKTAEQGAATAIWAAIAPVWEGTGGKYLVDCGVGVPAVDASQLTDEGYAPWAYSVEGEDKLWELSEKLTGVKVEV
ncbi:putative short-chain dehydrogenase [Xylariaceae sp. FL0255]|nr:putative short-chain dehydrogenase [Xylariaceae sp. FL0255]